MGVRRCLVFGMCLHAGSIRHGMIVLVAMILVMIMPVAMMIPIVVVITRFGMVMAVIIVMIMGVIVSGMIGGVIMTVIVMMLGRERLRGVPGIKRCTLDNLASHALAMSAAAGAAMTGAPAVGTVFRFLFGLAVGAFISLDQRLPVGDGDLVIVRVDFAEGEEAVAIAAVFDEGRLQRRFNAGDFGKVDITAKLLALG